MPAVERQLHLTYAGRIIDHLGLQMYQSPVAAIAELIANSWDADAEHVRVTLPTDVSPGALIVVEDDGVGMRFDDCQDHYLNVGRGRRGDDPDERSADKGRQVLGRKGIGKFAGFGIANIIEVDTTSGETGERTVFRMNLEALRGEEYIRLEGAPVELVRYNPASPAHVASHGTVVRLTQLALRQRPNVEAFARSMARRFLLHQQQADFEITINGVNLPEAFDLTGVEFCFPRDYRPAESPATLRDIDGLWGVEELNGRLIRWRFFFYRDPIDDEELRGISIFANDKLVQRPFFFNLTGGLGGQHGLEYLTGQVEADYLDLLPQDLTAPERQRINWENEDAAPLLDWGQERIKRLLRIWRERRGEERVRQITEKLATFSPRLEKLQFHEAKTVGQALRKLAQVPALSDAQFEELGDGVLTAWEQGRVRELIASIADANELSEQELLQLLIEAQVLTALSLAEAIQTKILTVAGLRQRIRQHELENAVRDYISKSPWLIAPEWETFGVERSVGRIMSDAASGAGFEGADWDGRVDLALSSGGHLLIIEFMRPGLRIDWDHIQRFERYVLTIRETVRANTAGPFRDVTGYIVADQLARDSTAGAKLEQLSRDGMYAMDWDTLFGRALHGWRQLLGILAVRTPDARISELAEEFADRQ